MGNGKSLRQEVKKAKRVLYKLMREVLVLRDGERCLRCGKTEALHMSHIYPKGKYRRLEFDIRNVKFLCNGCHLYWWHKNPIEAALWLPTVISESRLNQLKLAANSNEKYRLDVKLVSLELEQLKKRYTRKYF